MKFHSALRNPAFWPWLIVTPGIILRLWNLTSSPLWYDEAFTLLTVRLPLWRMLAAIAGDVHPPFYYLLLSLMVRITGDDGTGLLRLFSVACSLLALLSFHQLTGELGLPRGARLLALALMAYHPTNI